MKTIILVVMFLMVVACGKEVDPNDPNRDGGEVYLFYAQGACGASNLKLVGQNIEVYKDAFCHDLEGVITPGETKSFSALKLQVDRFLDYTRVRVLSRSQPN